MKGIIDELIERGLKHIASYDILADIRELCQFDRYQASVGIQQAAYIVAEQAKKLGIQEVKIETYPADGKTRWWSFQSPTAWTPVVALLKCFVNNKLFLAIDHATQPFSIATYSAATPVGGVKAKLLCIDDLESYSGLQGDILLVEREQFNNSQFIKHLLKTGASGFITDAMGYGVTEKNRTYPGRIELAPGSPVFGFSVQTVLFNSLKNAVKSNNVSAEVIINVDTSSSMPVVTGVLAPSSAAAEEEIWLTAHLCHPRPGANDNASGIVGLLGVAHVLSALLREKPDDALMRPVRFIWGPEFLGVAAYLYSHQQHLPYAVINLDMIGENQTLCGSPFIVERSPILTSLINPFAEYIVQKVFEKTAQAKGVWQTSPFLGFSDHALFADPSIHCPAIQLCHAPDKFNHTAADTIDKVSLIEMQRSITAAATLTLLLSNQEYVSSELIEYIVQTWCHKQTESARNIAARYAHFNQGKWSTYFLTMVKETNDKILASLTGPVKNAVPLLPASFLSQTRLIRKWSGPFNARSMINSLSDKMSLEVMALLKQRKFNVAILLNMARNIDNYIDQKELLLRTSSAIQQPISTSISDIFIAALIESGWVELINHDNGITI